MRAWKKILPALAAVLLAGCAGYHLGPVNGAVAGGKSLEVLPLANQTMQPRLGDAVTQALRERLQVDATYHLATSEPGDLVMSGVIRQYSHEGLGYLNRDAVTTQNYRVGVTVHVKGHTLVNVGPDFASSERQAMPLLAADLAQNIVELLAEGTW
jgi:hypothetical protein